MKARSPTRIGAVGYCMSGPFVMWAAAAFPDRLRCIASIHGANMSKEAPDSPHRIAAQVHFESYFACAEIDKWAPPAHIAALQAALDAAGMPHRIEWYPKVEHRFDFPLRAGICDRPTAERHYERFSVCSTAVCCRQRETGPGHEAADRCRGRHCAGAAPPVDAKEVEGSKAMCPRGSCHCEGTPPASKCSN